MSITITPSLVISVVFDLIRYRDRVDTILAVRQASEGLPFLLPPAPADEAPHLDEMVAFFATPPGQAIAEKRVDLAALEAYLTLAVKRVERELGRTIDGTLFPHLLERLAGAALDTPARLRPKPEASIEELLPPLLAELARLSMRT
jgi:hypothetical protein